MILLPPLVEDLGLSREESLMSKDDALREGSVAMVKIYQAWREWCAD